MVSMHSICYTKELLFVLVDNMVLNRKLLLADKVGVKI